MLQLEDTPIVCNIYHPLARLSEANCNMALQLVSGAYQGKAELAYLCRANGRQVGVHIFRPNSQRRLANIRVCQAPVPLTPVNVQTYRALEIPAPVDNNRHAWAIEPGLACIGMPMQSRSHPFGRRVSCGGWGLYWSTAPNMFNCWNAKNSKHTQ